MGLDASGLLVGLRLEDIRSPLRGGAGGGPQSLITLISRVLYITFGVQGP